MMDAFEDIRERLNRATDTEAAFPPDEIDKFVSPGAQQATEDVARLLSAVDGLMEVGRWARVLHEHASNVALDDYYCDIEAASVDRFNAALDHVSIALNILPPELKEALK